MKTPKFDLDEALDIVVENFRDPKARHLVRPYVKTLSHEQREMLSRSLTSKLSEEEADSISQWCDDLFE